MAIIKDYRGEWDVASVKVNFSNGDQRIYSGCKPLIVPNNYNYDEITNLTGTKWKLNDGFTAPAGYGIFNVEIDVIISDTTYQSSVLYIGYTGDMMSNPTEQENSNLIEYEEPAFGLMPKVIGAGNLIAFNSGVDATNTNLITWIQANATRQ